MNSEQIQSLIRNALQFAAGALGFGAYVNDSTLSGAVALIFGGAALAHSLYSAYQAKQAKDAVAELASFSLPKAAVLKTSMLSVLLVGLLLIPLLAGCQTTSSVDLVKLYADAATGTKLAMDLGKLTGDNAKNACAADDAAYQLVIANSPNADLTPANVAHASLQVSCAKLPA
jgi:hypothetical protein